MTYKKLGPLEVNAMTMDEVYDLVSETVTIEVDAWANAMALKALLHYEEGHWNEAQAAALTSVALRQMTIQEEEL